MPHFLLLVILFLTPSFAQDPIYWAYVSEYAKAGDEFKIGKHQSPYLAVLDKCFRPELSAFNITHTDYDKQWKKSVTCYDDENFNLSSNLRVKLEDCVDQRVKRGHIYDQAYCMQGKIIKAHNSVIGEESK